MGYPVYHGSWVCAVYHGVMEVCCRVLGRLGHAASIRSAAALFLLVVCDGGVSCAVDCGRWWWCGVCALGPILLVQFLVLFGV
eukprot:71717-Rhodomonas_salina.1